MNKLQKALKVYKEEGFNMIFLILLSRLGLISPKNAKAKWKLGIRSEIRFWDSYFRTKGLEWSDTYNLRLDPNRLLQSRPAALLPKSLSKVKILDVGAGPLTYLGKKYDGKEINITAIDPLAKEYDRILDKYNVQPLLRTACLAAEDIKKEFEAETFDLVVARNCIDHAYNPESAIFDMIDVAKKGSYVLLEHRENEAEKENWRGLHQWNFSMDTNGDFWIRSKYNEVNMNKKYSEICSITSELINEEFDGEWLVTRILKH